MSSTLCDLCHEKPASVFVTKIVNNHTTKHRLCADCARQAAGSSLGVDAGNGNPPLEEIMKSLFAQTSVSNLWSGIDDENTVQTEDELLDELPFDVSWSMSLGNVPGEFPGDEDLVDELDEEMDDSEMLLDDADFDTDSNGSTDQEPDIDMPSLPPSLIGEQSSTQIFGQAAHGVHGAGGVASVRCPKCDTTWDRLKQDGRAGCAQCYSAFAEQLMQVMARVQRSSQHAGKAPRTAEKRQRRLMHLRARRDHRLEMLNRRLEHSVAHEKYEEAAKLRDKIKIVTSTIVDG